MKNKSDGDIAVYTVAFLADSPRSKTYPQDKQKCYLFLIFENGASIPSKDMEKFIGETEEFVGDSIGETVNDKIKNVP